MSAERDKVPQGAPEAPEPLGELSRLWSPEQLRELEESRLRYGIGRVLSQLAGDVLGGKLKPKTAIPRLRKLADWIETELAPKPTAEQGDLELEHPEPKPPDDVVAVFAYWQRLTSRPNTALTKARRKVIAERLRSFTVDDLKLIVSTAHQSKFWTGEATNEGVPIDHIEKFMRHHTTCESLLEEGKRGGQLTLGESTVDSEIEELEDRAMRLSEEGRTEEANAVQREIRARLSQG